jgi:DNA polymerase-3 subunit beta
MKFSIEKSQLLQSLQHINKAIPTRSTLPVLSCALFDLKDNKLTIRTTNLEVYISVVIEVEDTASGKIAIPMNTLLDITSAMPEEFLHFEISDIGKVNIQSTCGRYTIMGQPADEFPSEPTVTDGNSLVVPSNQLLDIINSTVYATSRDEMKPVLQGVLFNMDSEGLTAVATDGHRLVRLKKFDLKTGSFNGSVIVPVKFLSLLKPFLDNEDSLNIKVGENHIQVEKENVKISSRIIKDRYPDYESVIPKDNDLKLLINKDDLASSVKRVSIFSNKSTKQIALSLDTNKLTVSTEDPENITTGRETVDCEYSGEPMIIGYNALYLGEVLKNQKTETLNIMLKSPLSAGIFLAENQDGKEDKTTLLMPIRLND